VESTISGVNKVTDAAYKCQETGRQSLVDKARHYLAPALPRATELVIERGEGPYLYTEDGDKYLDFVSGIGVCNLGHSHPAVIDAAVEQAKKLVHICHVTAYYRPAVELAEKLAALAPGDLDTTFFSNAGAEAVEGAIKLARHATRRPAVIAFRGAFHGRSLGATSLTASSVKYRTHHEPLLPSVYHVPFPYCFRCPYRAGGPDKCDLDCLREMQTMFDLQVAPSDVAAVIVEPMQGEGGYIPAPARYLRALRDLCTKHGILLIFDEVQTGFGRTGRWFCADHSGVVPDIMVLAKAIASGFPLSAIMARRELHERWPRGSHGTTFGANPVSCAASLAGIGVIESEGLVERSNELGRHIRGVMEGLRQKYPVIGDIRGLGCMIGVEFVKEDGSPYGEFCHKVIDYSFDEKLLFYTCGAYKQCVRFLIPLNIAYEDLNLGLERFERALNRAWIEDR